MLFPHPSSVIHHLANTAGALLVGAVFAFVGLNAASGCGQSGGECIAVGDLLGAPPPAQLARRAEHPSG